MRKQEHFGCFCFQAVDKVQGTLPTEGMQPGARTASNETHSIPLPPGVAKAAYPLLPSSFPIQTRFAGLWIGNTWGRSRRGRRPPPFCLLRRHFPRRGNLPLILRLARRKTIQICFFGGVYVGKTLLSLQVCERLTQASARSRLQSPSFRENAIRAFS